MLLWRLSQTKPSAFARVFTSRHTQIISVMASSTPDYALPLLRTWLIAFKPNSCLCCDSIGNVDQKVFLKNGVKMSVQICCGQMSITWHFKPQDAATSRMAIATSLDKLMHFECVAENCTPDIAFAHLMRQAVQHTEPLGLHMAAHRPVVLDVEPKSYAQTRWHLKPNMQIVGIDGRDVRELSSAEIATMLSQHPRPTAVTTMAVNPTTWEIPHRDDPTAGVEIQLK